MQNNQDTRPINPSPTCLRGSALRDYLRTLDKVPVICMTAFLVGCALGLINLGIIFHARDALNATPAAIGWLAAAWALGYVFGCAFSGSGLRHMAPRSLLIASSFGMSILFWGMSVTDSVPVLWWLSLLYGVVLSLFWPFLMGWLSMGYEGGQLGKAMAAYNFSWCCANVISPFLCGWLGERDTRWPLWGATGLVLASGLLLLAASYLLPRIRMDRTHLPDESAAAGGSPAGRRTRLRYAAWIGITMTYFGLGVVAAVFPVSARQDFGFSMFLVGKLMLVRALFNVVGFFALGKTDRWHFRAAPMLVGQGLGIAGFLGLMFVTSRLGIALALGVCGIAAALSYSYSMFHGVSGSAHRSQAMAIHEALVAAGLVLGGAVGGMLYQWVGMRLVYALCAAGIAAALPLQIAIARQAAKREAGLSQPDGPGTRY